MCTFICACGLWVGVVDAVAQMGGHRQWGAWHLLQQIRHTRLHTVVEGVNHSLHTRMDELDGVALQVHMLPRLRLPRLLVRRYHLPHLSVHTHIRQQQPLDVCGLWQPEHVYGAKVDPGGKRQLWYVQHLLAISCPRHRGQGGAVAFRAKHD